MTRALVILAIGLGAAPAGGDATGRETRVAYITELIAAIRTSDAATLENTSKYLKVIERNKCQAAEQSLRVGCLLEAAAQNCKQQKGAARERCHRVSDVIATNRLSEKVFVPKDVRYQIMNKQRDYRIALDRELSRRYATLVAELVMSDHYPGSGADDAALATGIEAYCRDTAGDADLSWQYCVAAVVWFVGTDGGVKQ